MERLLLGFKFNSGVSTKGPIDYVGRNSHWKDNDTMSVFKQGVVVCCSTAARSNVPTLPRRYLRALKELRNNNDIVVTTADKGGGVVIMNRHDYVKKMEDLLADQDTYHAQSTGKAAEEGRMFSTVVRRILNKTERGRNLLPLLEENPDAPRMRGLPKTHKPSFPLPPHHLRRG